MNRSIFKLAMVLFMIVSMASVSYAAPGAKLEQGGMTKAQAVGATVGGVAGAGTGIGGSVVLVTTIGTSAGYTGGAAITAGLAAIGGSLVGGIVVVTGGTALLAAGGIYGGYKLVRWYQTP